MLLWYMLLTSQEPAKLIHFSLIMAVGAAAFRPSPPPRSHCQIVIRCALNVVVIRAFTIVRTRQDYTFLANYGSNGFHLIYHLIILKLILSLLNYYQLPTSNCWWLLVHKARHQTQPLAYDCQLYVPLTLQLLSTITSCFHVLFLMRTLKHLNLITSCLTYNTLLS